MASAEFSFRSRGSSIRRLEHDTFDVLVVGGGITGAAVARDAARRGMSVALIERSDFSFGTSSRSSKLIHGGLRYLENLEFSLVFEALAERALLLRTMPHLVRPLPFYFPVYQGDAHGKGIMSLGMLLYDLLALFRTPGFHKRLSRRRFLEQIPFVRSEGLQGGFRYFDASMWDDVIGIEILRSAQEEGAAICNYTEALSPIWQKDLVGGLRVRDRETAREFDVRAHRTVVCAGPWTDEFCRRLSPSWKGWLKPSKGVHLVFDLKRIPVPGAMVMSHPDDGRISFVIPRPDLGPGVTIVGTTDSPVEGSADQAHITPDDVNYLLGLLARYFPGLELKREDIISGYVGVRPLVGIQEAARSLQKVSREHHIGRGPGGVTLVAGGKYTTHRRMAEEIVDFMVESWREDAREGVCARAPEFIREANTQQPVNPRALASATVEARREAEREGLKIPDQIFDRYGAEALDLARIHADFPSLPGGTDPEGFPMIEAQLRHSVRSGMVLRLEDFFFRRAPLFASRSDHGMPWAERLAQVWAEERELGQAEATAELLRLKDEVSRRSAWLDQKK